MPHCSRLFFCENFMEEWGSEGQRRPGLAGPFRAVKLVTTKKGISNERASGESIHRQNLSQEIIIFRWENHVEYLAMRVSREGGYLGFLKCSRWWHRWKRTWSTWQRLLSKVQVKYWVSAGCLWGVRTLGELSLLDSERKKVDHRRRWGCKRMRIFMFLTNYKKLHIIFSD